MDVKILKAEMNDFEEIIDVLVNSSLGQRYYPTPGMLRSEVLAARGRDHNTRPPKELKRASRF